MQSRNLHAERARVSLEGRRVRVRGENPGVVYFVTGQRDPGSVVPLDELPQTGSMADLVMDVPPVNPWRRSTWPTGSARTVRTSELEPVTPARAQDEHSFSCACRGRSAWSEKEQRVRAVNCICGADPLDVESGEEVRDYADEVVREDVTPAPLRDSKTAACGPDRD